MAAQHRIDLNADLGEGVGNDAAMLEIVTSANVATGAHAGDDATMAEVCRLAVARGVAIGAHVAYEDREGFGRRTVDIAADALAATVTEQILRLERHAAAAGGAVQYVKPHGALYNRIVADGEQASAVVRGVSAASDRLGRPLAVVGLPGSEVLRVADGSGLVAVPEAFADRAYAGDATLVPRAQDGAALDDVSAIAARAVKIAHGADIDSADGSSIRIVAASLCVHGDTPGAVEIARAVRGALEGAGVKVTRAAAADPPAFDADQRSVAARPMPPVPRSASERLGLPPGVEVRSAGHAALLVEFPTAAQARDFFRGEMADPQAPWANLVPGARTVLFDGTDQKEIGGVLATLRSFAESAEAPASGPVIELPVVFDGPDLDDVARHWGVARGDVVDEILAAELESEFCGFMPGFAYLVGLERETPRRDSPRTSVPAGAVGVAGEYAGVYPSSSPGGWQLVGTLAPAAPKLWDLERAEPALLAPGTRVRFVDAGGAS